MTTQDGNRANANEFNTSFMSRDENTSTIGEVALLNSGSTTIADTQDLLNALRTFIGQILPTGTEGDTPDWTAVDSNANIVGAFDDTLIEKIVATVLLFLGAGGHTHDGTDGNAPKIDLVSAVNGLLGPENGGTGLNASAAANGELLIGNGAGFTLATISGSTNQVTVVSGPGSITLTLPQDIHTGATPTFAQVAVSMDPSVALQVATKQYVDNLVQGIKWKENVRVATDAAGTLASDFENGDTVDGIVLVTGDRILIKDQVSGSENGIYNVEITGAPTRTSDADTFEELNTAAVYASQGTVNADKGFQQTAELTALSDPQTWVQNFGTGLYTVDGNALQELTARVFSLVIDGSTLTQSASGLKVADGVFVELLGDQSIDGEKTFVGTLNVDGDLCLSSVTDAATTGANASIPDPGKPIVEITNVSLTSVSSLFGSALTENCLILIANRTGNNVTFNHDSGSPVGTGFLLPGDANLDLQNNLTLLVSYSVTADRWLLVGGSGSGSGGGAIISPTLNAYDTPTTIAAAGSVSPNSIFQRQILFLKGTASSGGTLAGSIDDTDFVTNQEVWLMGTSDFDPVVIDETTSNIHKINGECVLGDGSTIKLIYNVEAGGWIETGRSE